MKVDMTKVIKMNIIFSSSRVNQKISKIKSETWWYKTNCSVCHENLKKKITVIELKLIRIESESYNNMSNTSAVLIMLL